MLSAAGLSFSTLFVIATYTAYYRKQLYCEVLEPVGFLIGLPPKTGVTLVV